MQLKEVRSNKEMLDQLKENEKNFILLYKKGSETSDCSYRGVEQAIEKVTNVNVLAADVSTVRDIHGNYSIASVPSLLVFDGLQFINTVKGCNDDGYYKSLFESALFTAKKQKEGLPQKRVTVYSTPGCSWCTTLKKHLDRHGIRYSVIDVSNDEKAAEKMTQRSGQQGVPQTDINGRMIVGFDKNKINALLGIQ